VHLGIIWAKEISNGANKYFSQYSEKGENRPKPIIAV
jgi:hypothetical protein